MTKYRAESYHASSLECDLHKQGYEHLRVRRYGALLVIESGPAKDAVKHARLRRVTEQYWTLEMATHTGMWQSTGLRDLKDKILEKLVQDFGWTLTAIE